MFKKSLITSAIFVAVAAASSAHAVTFPDFTVDPTISGLTTIPPAFVADKMTGNYSEVITFGAGNTFAVTLIWNAGQFLFNDGLTPVSGLANGSLNTNYGVYATLIGSGTFTQSGPNPNFPVTTFILNSGTVSLFYDDINADINRLTGLTLPGTGGLAVAKTNSGDDILLATGSVIAPSGGTLNPNLDTCDTNGNGTIEPGEGINCGSFGQSTTLALTSEGADFFVLPDPFFNVSFQSGQLNNFQVSDTQVINGSLDVVFAQVPEPGSLALAGIALATIGVVGVGRRRRQS